MNGPEKTMNIGAVLKGKKQKWLKMNLNKLKSLQKLNLPKLKKITSKVTNKSRRTTINSNYINQ